MQLSELTMRQIATGFENLKKHWKNTFPPNPMQLVDLCLGYYTDQRTQQRIRLTPKEYIPENDPAHIRYRDRAKALPKPNAKELAKAARDKAIQEIQNINLNTPCKNCKAAQKTIKIQGQYYCDQFCFDEYEIKTKKDREYLYALNQEKSPHV